MAYKLRRIVENRLLSRFLPGTRKNPVNEIIPTRPGAISGWIFPIYTGILCLCILPLWFIHHPDIIKTRAVLLNMNRQQQTIIIELDITQADVGKIDSGQLVQLLIYDFPVSGFGVVDGYLTHVSKENNNNSLVAEVLLPEGLITSKHKKIAYRNGMKGDILIYIKDMRLLERIFYRSAQPLTR
jgi:hypothetical protein